MASEPTAASSKLVSIICRTIGRRELNQAIDSIANQSYGEIELVLVNSAKQDLSSFDLNDISATVITSENKLSRTQAANAGIDAAKGSYLMFLDDDDWISPDHIANLLTILEESPKSLAAYSNTVKTTPAGDPTDIIFDRHYDPLLLMRDNYIPIHAVLFSKELIDRGCRFDEAFDIYEDWDFWLQVSQHTDFLHNNKTTAFYRSGGDSDTATENDSLRFQSDHLLGKARAVLFEKWKTKWDGDSINQMLGRAMSFNLADKLDELSQRFDQELEKSAKLERQVNSFNRVLNEKDAAIQNLRTQLNKFQSNYADLENRLRHKIEIEQHAKIHVQQLEAELNRIVASPSFRMMGPFRRVGRLFANDVVDEQGESIDRIDVNFADAELNQGQQEDQRAEDQSFENSEGKSEGESKKQYDDAANKALDEFLGSDKRLIIPTSDDAAVSIILVFFNQAHLSLLCLQSLIEKSDAAFELIIVDNASSDRSSALLDRIDNAKILRNKENLGFVNAVNQGADVAETDHILLFNNDAVIHNETLSSALNTIQENAHVGAVGGKILLTDGRLQEAGSIIWRDGSCLGYGRGDDPYKGEYNFLRDVDYCSGAFLLFRREDFESLGGFDSDYAPAYYEETDFCIRLQKKGLRIVYNPNAVITHYEFASTGGFSGASSLQKEHRKLLCDKHKDWLNQQLASDPKSILRARTRTKHPNVLVIDDRVPHPSLGSGYPRAAQLVNSLAALDLNVTLYPLQFPIDDWRETYQSLNSTIEVILNEGRNGLEEFLRERRETFQYIVVSRVHNMAFFKEIVSNNEALIGSTKIIYDAEALTAPREIMQRQLLQELVTEEEQKELIAGEMEHAALADAVIAVSDREAKIYRDHGIENLHVLGHTLSGQASDNSFQQREGILFVGALRDEGSPNVDSLLWFTINVLPLIEHACPGIKLFVVGDRSAASLASVDKTNISFLGRLESLEEIYASSRIFIAPTRFAAGIPHKVHEAAGVGVPCVTTPLLAEQLGWQHDQELLVGQNSEEFAKQCIRLYQDETLWNSIRENGLKAVDVDCSEELFQEKLRSIFA